MNGRGQKQDEQGETSNCNAVPAKPWRNTVVSLEWILIFRSPASCPKGRAFFCFLNLQITSGEEVLCKWGRLSGAAGQRLSTDCSPQLLWRPSLRGHLHSIPAQHSSMSTREERAQPSLPGKQFDYTHTASHLAPKAMSPTRYGVFPEAHTYLFHILRCKY